MLTRNVSQTMFVCKHFGQLLKRRNYNIGICLAGSSVIEKEEKGKGTEENKKRGKEKIEREGEEEDVKRGER